MRCLHDNRQLAGHLGFWLVIALLCIPFGAPPVLGAVLGVLLWTVAGALMLTPVWLLVHFATRGR